MQGKKIKNRIVRQTSHLVERGKRGRNSHRTDTKKRFFTVFQGGGGGGKGGKENRCP